MLDLIARLSARLGQFAHVRRGYRGGGERRVVASNEWVVIESNRPTPLLDMYRDVLRQAGIPATVSDGGVGRGAMGGVPGAGSLRVPSTLAEAARRLLGDDDARDGGAGGDQDAHESERIVSRDE